MSLTGADYILDDECSYLDANEDKNHYRMSDPCGNLADPQPGMLLSDGDDNRLYHVTDLSAYCSEILQSLVPLSDDIFHYYGEDFDSGIGYDETVNDALIWGIPISGSQRGLIICDVDDIGTDFIALMPFLDVCIGIIDQDADSVLRVGFAADDIPHLDSNRILRLQYFAPAGISAFELSAAGENRPFYIYGYITEKAGGAGPIAGTFQMEDVNNEFIVSIPNDTGAEGFSVVLNETSQRFRLRQNSDIMSWYLTATDAYMQWSDGTLILITDETDAPTVVRLMPNGTSEVSEIELYDTDGERLSIYTAADRAYITSIGGTLGINPTNALDVTLWEAIGAGNPSLILYGWNTAGGDLESTSLIMDDANDEFLIQAANSVNHEGITIDLLETNQQFRIRQNSEIISMYHDGSDPYARWSVGNFTFITDEGINTTTKVFIKGKGTGNAALRIYDQDDLEFFNISCSNSAGYFSTDGVAPGKLHFMQSVAQDVTFWGAIGTGNPDFELFGWITAGAAVRYGRFRMDDANDEFEIEAENNANHEGITVLIQEANQRFRVRGASRAERFWVDEDGLIGLMRQGELFMWPYQGDLADNATFNLPAFTDGCMALIQAGNNEEYAIFMVDDDGDVILIANSANVSANADNDGDLCIGTAATQEPLVIKNRLGATKNINLIMWYS